MARSSTDLPRMQNQAKPRAPLDRAAQIGTHTPGNGREQGRPQMMRQYELVERVKQYNPNTNEDLLNRAYVMP